ncbi:putative clathrin assembly protein At1g03050 [Zingiber officinale]|uniref:putative clathrin assembly protein At1g03050 n=1 Tax=Zingiber officinale TaxID=94328 RepID=UPI001C4D72BB|nr:putative clathrin assembly protein At1g03050 [Zingiber officinale]
MSPSKLRKAIGAVKDKTSIGLAKVSNSTSLSDLDVAIVKATRHDEFPADEKHIREIFSLTCYSRAHVGACVATLSRRLGKTRSWTVALKTLFLIHRLLLEGDSAYEKEIFLTTRRGTRMLNLSDFRDTSRSDAFDFSAFVRTYALYLDERLDYRMHGRRKRRPSSTNLDHDQDDDADPSATVATGAVTAAATASASRVATPVRDMPADRIFARTRHLQRMLERFLACRPTGAAKHNRIVAVALYPLVKESFKIYYDLVELMNIFVDRFMDLEVPECVSVHEIFHRLSKQFDELDLFYGWARAAGVCRSSEYPEIERITSKKLEVMEEFIRDKSVLAIANRQRQEAAAAITVAATKPPEEEPEPEYEKNALKALPAPEPEEVEEAQQERAVAVIEDNSSSPEKTTKEAEEEDVDFLNLKGDAMTGEEHGDQLALALFDGPLADSAAPKWEAFEAEDSSDWETALVAAATNLSDKRAVLGGGFDMLLLDGLYAQAQATAATERQGQTGSSSSVVIPPPQPMLALPAPPGAAGAAASGSDPFAASTVVPPPSYVQMSDMERKQHLMTDEQWMWEQYAKEGRQGQAALDKLQQQQQQLGHAAYARMH